MKRITLWKAMFNHGETWNNVLLQLGFASPKTRDSINFVKIDVDGISSYGVEEKEVTI